MALLGPIHGFYSKVNIVKDTSASNKPRLRGANPFMEVRDKLIGQYLCNNFVYYIEKRYRPVVGDEGQVT
jgi:hypothetical protein